MKQDIQWVENPTLNQGECGKTPTLSGNNLG